MKCQQRRQQQPATSITIHHKIIRYYRPIYACQTMLFDDVSVSMAVATVDTGTAAADIVVVIAIALVVIAHSVSHFIAVSCARKNIHSIVAHLPSASASSRFHCVRVSL